MRLYFLPHSPFVRKVVVVAFELGLTELSKVDVHPFEPDSELLRVNPIGKAPVLERDDGSMLYDSTVICQYLNMMYEGSLFPADGEQLWSCLKLNSLGDGLAQAATWNIRERYRPDGERSDTYVHYYERGIERWFTTLEQEVDAVSDGVHIGGISIACALSYVDFRYPEMAWRQARPALGRWYDAFAARPAMQASQLQPYHGPLSPPSA